MHQLHLSASWGDMGATKMVTLPVWRLAAYSAVFCIFIGSATTYFFATSLNSFTSDSVEVKQQLNGVRSSLLMAEEELSFKDQKIKVFAQELGVLQAKLNHFEEISERLFEDEHFGQYLAEFENLTPSNSAEIQVEERPVSIFSMVTQLASAKRRAEKLDGLMATTEDLLLETQLDRNLKPHHWPVIHRRSYVSSHYGWRTDPFSKKKHWHSGMDVAAAYNAPVVSSADGVIVFAGYRFGYGIMVEILHGENMVTRYAHLNKATVHTNQRVQAGELIGMMGSTGRATGPHLHFELLVGGHKVNPYPFIKNGRKSARLLALESTKYKTNHFK